MPSEKILSMFRRKLKYNTSGFTERELSRENKELPMLSFSCISAATGNFSLANKLGEGGFGPVFKVLLFRNVRIHKFIPYIGHIQENGTKSAVSSY